jgi:hypothetical protein
MSNVYRLSTFTGSGMNSRIEVVVELGGNPQDDTLNEAANEAVFKRWWKLNPGKSTPFPWPLSFDIEAFPTCDVNILTPSIPAFIASSGAKVWITEPTWELKPEQNGRRLVVRG